MVARVRGVGPVVPHDPHIALGHDDVEGHVRGGAPGLDVVLVEHHPVHAQAPRAVGDDVVPGQADDPLDEDVSRVLRQLPDEDEQVLDDASQPGGLFDVQPVVRVPEDDDVATLKAVSTRHPHGDVVAHGQGVLHGGGGDLEPVDDVGLDECGHGKDRDEADESRQSWATEPAGGGVCPPA